MFLREFAVHNWTRNFKYICQLSKDIKTFQVKGVLNRIFYGFQLPGIPGSMSEMWLLGKRETEEGAELYQEEYRKLMAKNTGQKPHTCHSPETLKRWILNAS